MRRYYNFQRKNNVILTKSHMKKYISFLPFVFVIVSSVFLPQIKVEINIKPQSQSIVKAEKTENSVREKAHCVVFYNSSISKITDNINSYYDRGYRLKNLSAAFTNTGVGDRMMYYAPVCKE